MEWRNAVVKPETTLTETIERIDRSALQIGLVVDDRDVLVGVVTDGDIRRAILRGVQLSTPIRDIMNAHPRTLPANTPRPEVLAFMRRHTLHQVPLIDGAGKVEALELLDRVIGAVEMPNPVVLMAGGVGARLRPLTEECPKPLLAVGGKPILEHILETFIEEGFRHFYLSVNYKAEMICRYFANGEQWGVHIDYLHEIAPLGTAGSLSLLPERPKHALIVMNADLLTKISFISMLDFHESHHSLATMAVREYDAQIPYGVVTVDADRILGIEEKPIRRCFVNAGIYVLQPEAIDHIHTDTFLDMPTLFHRLRSIGTTMAFPLRDYWMDIGRHEELERAHAEWETSAEKHADRPVHRESDNEK